MDYQCFNFEALYGEKREEKQRMKLGFKIWLLIVMLILSLVLIFGLPPKFFDSGVVVTSVGANSTLFDQGMRQGQILLRI